MTYRWAKLCGVTPYIFVFKWFFVLCTSAWAMLCEMRRVCETTSYRRVKVCGVTPYRLVVGDFFGRHCLQPRAPRLWDDDVSVGEAMWRDAVELDSGMNFWPSLFTAVCATFVRRWRIGGQSYVAWRRTVLYLNVFIVLCTSAWAMFVWDETCLWDVVSAVESIWRDAVQDGSVIFRFCLCIQLRAPLHR
jgi:hypothetical protein